MFCANLIHRRPRTAGPGRRRCAPPSTISAEPSLPPRAARGIRFDFEHVGRGNEQIELSVAGWSVESSHSPLIGVAGDEDRSAPSIVLRSVNNASSVKRGFFTIAICAVHGSVIQTGNNVRVPSGCSMTKWLLPPCCKRRNNSHALTCTRVMRVLDQNVKALFLGSMSRPRKAR